jgi:hypothetical protein
MRCFGPCARKPLLYGRQSQCDDYLPLMVMSMKVGDGGASTAALALEVQGCQLVLHRSAVAISWTTCGGRRIGSRKHRRTSFSHSLLAGCCFYLRA